MPCRIVDLGDGVRAIVCGPVPRPKRCACGEPGLLLCDWKTRPGKTCDRPICRRCAVEVAADKHLCRPHQGAYQAWLAGRTAKGAPA